MTVNAAEQRHSSPSFSIQNQRLSLLLNLENGHVEGCMRITVKPLSQDLSRLCLNARLLEIKSILINDVAVETFKYEHGGAAAVPSVRDLAAKDTETRREENVLKYGSRWLRMAARDFSVRELEIPVDAELIRPVEAAVAAGSEPGSNPPALPPVSFLPLTITITYELPSQFLGHGPMSLCRSAPSAASQYVQLMGVAVNPFPSDPTAGMARYWMPCLDEPGDRVSSFEIEYSVAVGPYREQFDRIHVVSSGILARQFVNEDRTVKVFQYQILDLPVCPKHIAFVAGVFDAVKVPGVPFAFGLCPVGRAGRLNHVVDFLGKSFNFFNWFLNSRNGHVRSLSSACSEVFPFPSYYMAFVKDLPTSRKFLSAANLTLVSYDRLHDAAQIEQTLETRRILARGLADQYFCLRLDLKTPSDCWVPLGIATYLSELQLRVFHGQNDYRLQIREDIDRLVELESSNDSLYVPPLASLVGYLREQGPRLRPLDRSRLEEILQLKSRLIMILLERKIEKSFLQKLISHIYTESLNCRHREGFSSALFLKLIKRLTGKDLKSFTDQWILSSGTPQFSLTFSHNRKRSTIDFDLSVRKPAAFRFSGNLTIRVAEAEAMHEHVVHIDESTAKFEVSFHSKAKKARKRKPAATAATEGNAAIDFDSNDEADDLEMGDDWQRQLAAAKQQQRAKPTVVVADIDEDVDAPLISPISWIRADPEMDWLATFNVLQPDIMLIEQLEGDRDVVAQWEACRCLPLVSPNSDTVALALERCVADWKTFWKIRAGALKALGQIGASLSENIPCARIMGARKLVDYFAKKHGLGTFGTGVFPKANDYEVLTGYLLQATVPGALSDALCAAIQGAFETDEHIEWQLLEPFLNFFINLLYYNDNSTNSYSDGEYLAGIIRSSDRLFTLLRQTEETATLFAGQQERWTKQLQRYAMLERFLPSFRNAVMVAVLEADCRTAFFDAQKLTQLLHPANYTLVRVEALRSLVHRSVDEAGRLLKPILQDKSVEFRRLVMEDPMFFDLVRSRLRAADSEEGKDAHLEPFIGQVVFDHALWNAAIGACAAIEGVAMDDSPAVETGAPSMTLKPIKITLNIGAAQPEPSGLALLGSSSLATSSADRLGEDNDDDDIWLNELSSNKTPASAGDDEVSRLLQVWQVLWSNFDSIPFRYPVDPSVPGYYAIIREPMDLSTARDRLSTLDRFLHDLKLIFQNCFTFNQPDSLICEQANRLRVFAVRELRAAFVKDKKQIKRTLLTAQEDTELLTSLAGAMQLKPLTPIVEEDVFETESPAKVPKLSFKVKMPPSAGASVSEKPSFDRRSLEGILNRLCKHRLAYFFLEPVDPVALNLPTYFDIVKHPMDFGSIRSKLQASAYREHDEFASDVRLVFSNCRAFNAPGTLVVKAAEEIEKLFDRDWTKVVGKGNTSNPESTNTDTSSTPRIKLSLTLASKD